MARFGGDEFAVIQIGLNQPDGALRLARRLMSTTDNPFVLDGKRASVSLSLGIAVYPTDAEEPEQLLRRADVALYRSKEGRPGQTSDSSKPTWMPSCGAGPRWSRTCAPPSSATNWNRSISR